MTASIIFLAGTPLYAKQDGQQTSSDTVLAEAEAMLRNNETHNAYKLLDKVSDQYIGEKEYDYLYGLAALRSGKPGLAIFALERAVSQQPDSGIYLLDLGRAYFEARDYPQAQATFNRVLALNPPETITGIINKYINSIEKFNNPDKFDLTAQISLTGGNDSNVNNATSADTIQIHNVLFYLNEQSKQLASPLQQASFNTSMNYSPTKKLNLFSNVNLSHTLYPEARFVDTSKASLGAGIGYSGKYFQSQNFASVQRTDVAREVNSYIAYGVTDQQWHFPNKISLALYGHAGMSKLPEYSVQNARFTTAGSRISYRLPNAHLSLSGFGSLNLPEQSISPYASKSVGMQTSIKIQTGKIAMLYLDGMAKYSDFYRGYIGLERQDAMGRVSTGFKITPAKKWVLNPEFSFTKAKSKIDLFEYDKLKVSVSIQRQLI